MFSGEDGRTSDVIGSFQWTWEHSQSWTCTCYSHQVNNCHFHWPKQIRSTWTWSWRLLQEYQRYRLVQINLISCGKLFTRAKCDQRHRLSCFCHMFPEKPGVCLSADPSSCYNLKTPIMVSLFYFNIPVGKCVVSRGRIVASNDNARAATCEETTFMVRATAILFTYNNDVLKLISN